MIRLCIDEYVRWVMRQNPKETFIWNRTEGEHQGPVYRFMSETWCFPRWGGYLFGQINNDVLRLMIVFQQADPRFRDLDWPGKIWTSGRNINGLNNYEMLQGAVKSFRDRGKLAHE